MERAHPRAFPLIYRARAGTDNERAVNEEIMEALAASGLDPPTVALAYQTLIAFLDGALLHWPRSTWRVTGDWEWIAAHGDRSRYPRMVETARFAAALEWDDIFNTGLELLLRGLAAGVARTERSSSN
jgi:hypothetical protein